MCCRPAGPTAAAHILTMMKSRCLSRAHLPLPAKHRTPGLHQGPHILGRPWEQSCADPAARWGVSAKHSKIPIAVLRSLQAAVLCPCPCLSVQPWECKDVGGEQHRCTVSTPRWVRLGYPVLLGHLEDPHHKHLQEGGHQSITSPEHPAAASAPLKVW